MAAVHYGEDFYATFSDGSYRSARRMAAVLARWLDVRSVADFGCGIGAFLKAFSEAGIADHQGIDGDYVRRDQLLIEAERFLGRDLGAPVDLGRRFDLVVSLEVGEHLPADRAEAFVDTLCRHGDVVLFSAAVPGQGGPGHVNEQWPSYWADKFAARGYGAIDVLRPAIWSDAEVEVWYRQNSLLFATAEGRLAQPRLAAAATGSRPLDIVHPEMFAHMVRAARSGAMAIARMRQLCAAGGAYRFSMNAAGMVEISRHPS